MRLYTPGLQSTMLASVSGFRHTTFVLTFYIILFILCNVYVYIYYKWSMKTFSTFHINRSENALTISTFFIRSSDLLRFAMAGFLLYLLTTHTATSNPPTPPQPVLLPSNHVWCLRILFYSLLIPLAIFLLYWIRYDFKCFFIPAFCCYFPRFSFAFSGFVWSLLPFFFSSLQWVARIDTRLSFLLFILMFIL